MDPITVANVASTTASPLLIKWYERAVESISLSYKTKFMKDRDHFMRYLDRTYEKFSKIKPIGFSDYMDFKSIYIPLTLVKDRTGNGSDSISINSFPKDLVKTHNHLLIVDNAGMGKSTITRRMFIDAYEDGSCGIPIIVELRHLSKEHDLLKEILEQIRTLSGVFDERVLRKLFESGHFIIFLDGYDEILLSEKTAVTKSLMQFIDKTPNIIFILTSRQDDALSGFQTFCQYSIKPMIKEEAYKLLSNLDKTGEKSSVLIDRLKTGESGVEDFLQNPLLVTLLFTAYNYKPNIPTKKHLFYEQIFDALFLQHDLSKGDGYEREKKSKLDKDEFERILRYIGFSSVAKHKIEFVYDDIIKIINLAQQSCRCTDFISSNYLDDLIHAVPIFLKDGHLYKWAHKSLSEYFAVKYLAYDSMNREEEYAMRLYNDGSRNANFFDLYFDIKPSGFNQYLLLPCLTEIKNELLPQIEDDSKVLFCSNGVGRTLYFVPYENDNNEKKYVPRLMKQYNASEAFRTINLSEYLIMVIYRDSAKWSTILEILYRKRHLYNIELCKKETVNPKGYKILKAFLNKKRKFQIDFSNIYEYTPQLVSEICSINPIALSYRIRFTREDCEKLIQQIKSEINNAKEDSFWD